MGPCISAYPTATLLDRFCNVQYICAVYSVRALVNKTALTMLASTVQSLFSELAAQEHVHYKRANPKVRACLSVPTLQYTNKTFHFVLSDYFYTKAQYGRCKVESQ